MKLETISNSILFPVKSSFQICIAFVVINYGDINFVLDKLERSIIFVLAPSSNPAPDPSTIAKLEVKLVVTRWQASSVDITMVQVDSLTDTEYGDIIAQSLWVKLWVLSDPRDCVLLMLLAFRGVEPTGIILSNTNLDNSKKKLLVIKTIKLLILTH